MTRVLRLIFFALSLLCTFYLAEIQILPVLLITSQAGITLKVIYEKNNKNNFIFFMKRITRFDNSWTTW